MTAEAGQDFAARYWGGADVIAVESPVTFGRRACDGGRPRFPAGWAFSAEGFAYRVWRKGKVWHMETSDGSFASWILDGDDWVVTTMSEVKRVTAMHTGDCFWTAARLTTVFGEFANNDEYRLAHGMVTSPDDGTRHWHAWVERDFTLNHESWPYPIAVQSCIDRSNGHNSELPRTYFYKLGGIDPDAVLRYTTTEAELLMLRTGHWGPWEDA